MKSLEQFCRENGLQGVHFEYNENDETFIATFKIRENFEKNFACTRWWLEYNTRWSFATPLQEFQKIAMEHYVKYLKPTIQ